MISTKHLLNIGCRSTCLEPVRRLAVPIFGFKQAANDGEEEFGTEAADFIRRNIYVDDGLKSLSTVSATTRLIQNNQAMCAKAGIRLHKQQQKRGAKGNSF